jgi:hypothetical protein
MRLRGNWPNCEGHRELQPKYLDHPAEFFASVQAKMPTDSAVWQICVRPPCKHILLTYTSLATLMFAYHLMRRQSYSNDPSLFSNPAAVLRGC